jgi:hypothetical protein
MYKRKETFDSQMECFVMYNEFRCLNSIAVVFYLHRLPFTELASQAMKDERDAAHKSVNRYSGEGSLGARWDFFLVAHLHSNHCCFREVDMCCFPYDCSDGRWRSGAAMYR